MRIFISYRREDSQDIAGRLYDRLESRFGPGSLFIDIDGIPFGVDFRRHLQEAIGNCDVVLVLIGDRWLNIAHEGGAKQGERRLDDPADFVRVEIESALKMKIPVVPVLVGSATMPADAELPDGMKELAYRNAAQVHSGREFRDDVERLIRGLEWVDSGRATKVNEPLAKEPAPNPDDIAGDATNQGLEIEPDLSSLGHWNDEAAFEFGASSSEETLVSARVVHMHERSGVLADLMLPPQIAESAGRVQVAFVVPPNGSALKQISVDVSPRRHEAVRYFRLAGLRLGPEWWSEVRPVTLRVYRSAPLGIGRRPDSEPGIRVESVGGNLVSAQDLGILVKDRFRPVVNSRTALPCMRKLRLQTTRDNQRVIRILPAIASQGEEPRILPPLAARIGAIAKAGIAWKEFTFRVDPDGRVTITARDPFSEKLESELLVFG